VGPPSAVSATQTTSSGSNMTNNPLGSELSTGAKAGIGVGSAARAAAIAVLAFALWQRSRRHKDPPSLGDAVSTQPYLTTDIEKYPSHPMEMAAVGAAGMAAASARDRPYVSYSGTGVTPLEPSSPTSSMQNTGRSPSLANYQQPYAAPTAYPGYPAYVPPPSDTYGTSPSPPPAAYDSRALSPPGYAAGYPQGMAEMVGANMSYAQGPAQDLHPNENYDAHEISAAQHYPAHELPANLQLMICNFNQTDLYRNELDTSMG
jgi:hypothetical protein